MDSFNQKLPSWFNFSNKSQKNIKGWQRLSEANVEEEGKFGTPIILRILLNASFIFLWKSGGFEVYLASIYLCKAWSL